MHNQLNNQDLKSDIRFIALLKKQAAEHQHLMSAHHKEMQDLRDSLTLSKQRFDALFQLSEQHLKEFKSYMISHIEMINQKLRSNEGLIDEQKRIIVDLHQQLHNFHTVYCSKIEIDKLKKELSSNVNQSTTNHILTIQELQRELKSLFNFLNGDFTKHKNETEKKFIDLIDQIEKNFNITKIEREGILKEISIYGKDAFIISKKIENIYTLIERINKKGEVTCHKPA